MRRREMLATLALVSVDLIPILSLLGGDVEDEGVGFLLAALGFLVFGSANAALVRVNVEKTETPVVFSGSLSDEERVMASHFKSASRL